MKGPITCIFIGKSGAGKGTQSDLLINYLQARAPEFPALQLETGQYFRSFINGESYSAGLSRELMKTGKLQPAFLAIWGWTSAFINQLTGKEHIIFDGTPRTLIEAEALDTALKFYDRSPRYIIYLQISDDEATRRLLARGRADDVEGDIKSRLEWYRTEVEPALNYYQTRPEYQIITVDGDQPIEAVHQAITSAF